MYPLVPALIAAFRHFTVDAVKRDPRCLAKQAIARALVALDCDDGDLLLEGMRLRQPEPVWGGSEDTAVDVRVSCAMALVNCGYPRAIHHLAVLLSDEEALARQGAVRAIACCVPREAEALLRFKALSGDPEPAVLGDCFIALLGANPVDSPEFVAAWLNREDDAAEQAALALGESRLPAALPFLQRAWEEGLLTPAQQRVIARAFALHRSEPAYEFLLGLIREGSRHSAQAAIDALSIYKQNDSLRGRVEAAVHERNDARLREEFAKGWE
jgi:hypothetical protein